MFYVQAVEYLRQNGVESRKDWRNVSSGTLIIRAHGMPVAEIGEMKSLGYGVVDATCPHVVTSQKQIRKYSESGYRIILIGDKDHPEILSLQSFAGSGGCQVIESLEEAKNLDLQGKIMVIAQTTFNAEDFRRISAFISERNDEVVVCNSICQATSERQQEIMKLAAQADMVVVVGGKESANTRRLAEIAGNYCQKTFHVETAQELHHLDFSGINKVAVTAGASTPDFITEEVIDFLKSHSR